MSGQDGQGPPGGWGKPPGGPGNWGTPPGQGGGSQPGGGQPGGGFGQPPSQPGGGFGGQPPSQPGGGFGGQPPSQPGGGFGGQPPSQPGGGFGGQPPGQPPGQPGGGFGGQPPGQPGGGFGGQPPGQPGGGFGGQPPGGGFGSPPGQPGGGFGGQPPGQPGGFGGGGPGQPGGGWDRVPEAQKPPKKPMSKAAKMIFAGGALFLLVSCCGCLIWAGIEGQKNQEEFGPLSAACDGQGVMSAAEITDMRQSVAVFERRSDGAWHYALGMTPSEFRASSRATTSRVVCIEEAQAVQIDMCDFIETIWGVDRPGTETSFRRSQQQAPVRMVNARSGAVIVTDSIMGEMPSCDDFGDEPTASDFEGDEPGEAEVRQWLVGQLGPG